jgi:hypothetical protein
MGHNGGIKRFQNMEMVPCSDLIPSSGAACDFDKTIKGRNLPYGGSMDICLRIRRAASITHLEECGLPLGWRYRLLGTSRCHTRNKGHHCHEHESVFFISDGEEN